MADMDTGTRERLTEAARACRILDMEGHGDMTLGHLSVREAGGHGFWMKRNQIGLGEVLGPDDFVLVDWDGQQIAGSGGRHSEWPIHSEIFRARLDINLVVHTHPFYASVFSAATEPLQPYTLDADQFTDVPRHEADVALITLKSEGEAIAHSLGQYFAMLLGNHGVVFCGTIIGRAADLKTDMPDRAVRDKRHQQISTPAHWQHSYRYFCRKLEARAKAGGGPAIFG
jgi:ribulose-5-phosphate 4-epimerase/fuculose-1-phosphate aldolase